MTSKQWQPTARQAPEMKPAPPLMSLQTNDAYTIAEVIVTNAFEWAGARLNCPVSRVVQCLNHGDPAARREFKLGLARYLAEYLGFLDEDVKAVYVSDLIENYRDETAAVPSRWVIHLAVFADPKTAALASLVNAMNRALILVLDKEVAGAEPEGFLDVQLVNSADLENLARYAALLSAPNSRPTRIWQREPSSTNASARAGASGQRTFVTRS